MTIHLGNLFHGFHGGGIGHHHIPVGSGHHHHHLHHHHHPQHHSNDNSSLLLAGILCAPRVSPLRLTSLVPFKVPDNTVLTIVALNGQFPTQSHVPNDAARFIYLNELNQLLNDANLLLKGAYPSQFLLVAITLVSMAAGSLLYLTVFEHNGTSFVIVLTLVGMAAGFVFSQIALTCYLQVCEKNLRQAMRNFINQQNQRSNTTLSLWEEFIPPMQARDIFPVYLFLVTNEESIHPIDEIVPAAAVHVVNDYDYDDMERPSAPLLTAEAV